MKILLQLHVTSIVAIGILLNVAHANFYTLDQAIIQAQKHDPWLMASVQRQRSLEARSIAAGTLPDPTVNAALTNLPVDSFDFNQENMTQFKLGISQLFPRGETRLLEQQHLERLSQIQPYAREDRKAQVAMTVAHAWLEVYRNKKTIGLIEKDRRLFEHLVDVAQSNYATAIGRTRQQDLIRAQLELTRLDDRLMRLSQQRDIHLAKLGEWLNDLSISFLTDFPLVKEGNQHFIQLLAPQLVGEMAVKDSPAKQDELLAVLVQHPKIKGIDWRIQAFDAGVALAKQSYKPQWGVNASYGYRDQTLVGDDRPDFFSIGMMLDIPLFTVNRQDKTVQSAQAEFAAVKTERLLALRQLKSGYESAEAMYRRLVERKRLFDSRLLKKMDQQAQASLAAYTNDDGDFAEAVRARIATLNARIDALDIDVDRQKSIAQLNYFQAGVVNTPENLTSLHFDRVQQQ